MGKEQFPKAFGRAGLGDEGWALADPDTLEEEDTARAGNMGRADTEPAVGTAVELAAAEVDLGRLIVRRALPDREGSNMVTPDWAETTVAGKNSLEPLHHEPAQGHECNQDSAR